MGIRGKVFYKMVILLLGKFGQLGWELRRTLATLGEVVAYDYPEVDFARVDDLREKAALLHPQVIINAVAYTAVDRAESQPELVHLVNAEAPGALANLAQEMLIPFIHYSTDYVFDGEKGSPYIESDVPNPLNVYGQSKLEGEEAVRQSGAAYLILRTSWVYSLRQGGFVNKVLQWSRSQTVLRMVTDQVGSPTSARLLAEVTAQLLAKADKDLFRWIFERRGLYHLAGDGAASRFEWAQEIIKHDAHPEEQILQEIQPALTAEFASPTRRPLFSALDCRKFIDTFWLRLPDWKDGLVLAMNI
jgi:dTDP-4-dehydrorhamnose reductase